jgi:hypothetical protein
MLVWHANRRLFNAAVSFSSYMHVYFVLTRTVAMLCETNFIVFIPPMLRVHSQHHLPWVTWWTRSTTRQVQCALPFAVPAACIFRVTAWLTQDSSQGEKGYDRPLLSFCTWSKFCFPQTACSFLGLSVSSLYSDICHTLTLYLLWASPKSMHPGSTRVPCSQTVRNGHTACDYSVHTTTCVPTSLPRQSMSSKSKSLQQSWIKQA